MSKQIYSYLRNENKILCNLRDVCDYNLYDVLDLLNSLSDENEKLKKERDYWASKYEEGTETLNEKNKIRITIVAELCVCITMLILFLSETEKLYQFFNLLLAMFSMSLAVENHFKLVKFKENE